MMRFHTVLIVLVLCAASLADAQTAGRLTQLRLAADVMRYRGGTDSTLLIEVSYSFPRSAMTFQKSAEGWSGSVEILFLLRRADSVRFADRWAVPSTVADTADLRKDLNLVGVASLEVLPGSYLVSLSVRDKGNPGRGDSIVLPAVVQQVPADRFALSDVELASSIRQSAEKTMFYKNTLEVVPNVGGIYSGDKILWYYCEAYNLQLKGSTAPFKLQARILDALGRQVISRTRDRKRAGESSVLVDQIPVNGLKSGTYQLVLTASDSAEGQSAMSGRKFFVYNPELGVDSSLLQASTATTLAELAGATEEEVNREGEWIKYEATSAQKSQWKELKSVDARKKFLTDFWHQHPAGMRDMYIARVRKANERWTSMLRDGWKTDMGRILILYGEPDEIERHPNESGSRPYEIWTYNGIQGGVIFVFGQRRDGGPYEQMHSTLRTEMQDDDWLTRLNNQ
jgi:GWxTD domain-containing protein